MTEIGLHLLPAPRRITYKDGLYSLPAEGWIVLDGPAPQQLTFSAKRIQRSIHQSHGLSWQSGAGQPILGAALVLQIFPMLSLPNQGYTLKITPAGILIRANTAAGVFYGVCTLAQILVQNTGVEIPCLEIEDGPDLPVRGVLLDISRDKVPQLNTLFDLIDRLASWKINQFQLYTEHTFAYRNHPDVWRSASPISGEEILALDAYCQERFIELVPNQASFGHMNRWLIHPRYQHLAESMGELDFPWGKVQGPFSLCPEMPESFSLVQGLYDELLPHFTSRMVNINCDETFDVGQGKSKSACQERTPGQVYLDFVLKLYSDLKRRGYTMQFWVDIVLHHPELIPQIPRDAIGLLWGYDAGLPYLEESRHLAENGLSFYVCPGTSSWNSLAGRTDNALNNLQEAAQAGIQTGASGYLNTDWGDNGHWQMLPISYLGFAAGAAYSWCLEANLEAEISHLTSLFAFDDPSGRMGRMAYDLGNLYQVPGFEVPNSSVLFWALRLPLAQIRSYSQITAEDYQRTLQALDQAASQGEQDTMTRPDAALIRREFALTVRMLRHACFRSQLAWEDDPSNATRLRSHLADDLQEIIAEYRALWLERNRSGGLTDSLRPLQNLLTEYQA